MGHFNHSVVATQALLKNQPDGNKALKLIQDVATRWNSSYLMIKRLLQLRVPVYAVLHDESVTKPSDRSILDLNDSNWKVLEIIMPILEPFVQATEILGIESTPTGSQVFILLHGLFQTLAESDIDSGIGTDLKLKIKAGIKKRFHVDGSGIPIDDVVQCSPLILALALDPRYKSLKILSPPQQDIVRNRVNALVANKQSENPEAQVKVKIEGEPQGKKPKITDCLLGDVIVDLTNDDTIDEYSDFLKEPIRIANPLEWWSGAQTRYPKLAQLAKQYLCIPATSVPSERVFSVAGLTVSKLRGSLDPDTVNEILFLHKHLKPTISDLLKQFSADEPQTESTAYQVEDIVSVQQATTPRTSNVDIKQECNDSNSNVANVPSLPSLPSDTDGTFD